MESTTADIIEKNQTVEIVGLDDGETGQRLSEMGFRPGNTIKLILSAPFGGPLAFELENTVIALRKDEANKIKVRTSSAV